MAGHALRYDGAWYYRAPSGAWSLVERALAAGREVPTRDRAPVDADLEHVLEVLYGHLQAGDLPQRIAEGLLVAVPPAAAELEVALRRRPDRAQP